MDPDLDPDQAPDPAIFVSDLQNANKKFFFILVLHHFLKIKSQKEVKKQ
jgi:hypothetical protein